MAGIGVHEESKARIFEALKDLERFETISPAEGWRGKFHRDFVTSFLAYMRMQRVAGTAPFARAANVSFDPKHPTALAGLYALLSPPQSLQKFVAAIG